MNQNSTVDLPVTDVVLGLICAFCLMMLDGDQGGAAHRVEIVDDVIYAVLNRRFQLQWKVSNESNRLLFL